MKNRGFSRLPKLFGEISVSISSTPPSYAQASFAEKKRDRCALGCGGVGHGEGPVGVSPACDVGRWCGVPRRCCSASIAVAIVLAVYMPPHAPWPGHE